MTMSVGLGRIVADPQAPVLTRKALGVLSEPGLLCYDDALTIDDTGRFVVRVKPDGKILKGPDGLYLQVTIGIDSEVNLDSEEYDRDWNCNITGTAPNYFESPVAIGSREFNGISAGLFAQYGNQPEDAFVCITASQTQLRLRWDASNYMAFRTLPSGESELYCIGTVAPQFHIITGDGTISGRSNGLRINWGSTIRQVFAGDVQLTFSAGGSAGVISWEELYVTVTSPDGRIVIDDEVDHVTVSPLGGLPLPSEWIAFTARVDFTNRLCIRVSLIGVTAGDTRRWRFVVWKMTNG